MTDDDDSKHPERMRPGLPHRQQRFDADRHLISIELPPDTLNRMDALLEPDETREDFVRVATRNEIARRKAERGERDKTDAEDIVQNLRKLVIDIKDALAHARYRLNGLDLILESFANERAQSASQEIFGLADEKLDAVGVKLDELYRQLSALEREVGNNTPPA